jgi:hypothetical protein
VALAIVPMLGAWLLASTAPTPFILFDKKTNV